MRDFQDERRWKRWWYSKISLLALGLLVVVLGRATWQVYQKDRLTAAKQVGTESGLKELTDQQEALLQGISQLQTARGMETEIRKKFPVAKAGEQVIVVVGDEPPPPPPEKSWWQRWFGD